MSNNKPHISAAAFITDSWESPLDFKIALIQRTDEPDGPWGFPAGVVEPGETPEETVLRELLEETGYRGVILGLRVIIEWGENSIGYIFNVALGEKVSKGEYPLEFVTHTEFLAAISGERGKKLYKPLVHMAALYPMGEARVRLPKRS